MSNLAYEVQWQDLKDHMRNAGSVIRADIIVGPDGRSKGLGTVEFSKPYEVFGHPQLVPSTPSSCCCRRCLLLLILVIKGVAGARVLWWGAVVVRGVAGYQLSPPVFRLFLFLCRCTCTRVQAKNAISQLSESDLMGRPILVREDRGDSGKLGRGVGGAAGAKVYVGNLSWEVQWQDLKDHMRGVRKCVTMACGE